MKENEFKVGDWVTLKYKSYTRPYKVLEVMLNEVLLNTGEYPKRDNLWKLEDCSHWIPKVGDWVVIADDITSNLYAVFQFNNHSRDRQILPLAFLQTLKDQS